ncbi:DUF4244 domain-containing protein [Actinotalea sp.]|uniref:DUF4244 domain-containing protein n=1 Tax=Actinotalea sp. TaxID=1872145 RepID=UPI00356B0CC5
MTTMTTPTPGTSAEGAAEGGSAPAARWLAPWGGPVRDAGMATAEYAIVTVAAAGFAGLLLVILRSDEVRSLLLGIVRSALAV